MKALKIGNLLASLPIVQGGMGVGISLSGLASAVAEQGGIGVISSAGLGAIYNDYSKDYRKASIWGLKEELRKARERTRGIIGVNYKEDDLKYGEKEMQDITDKFVKEADSVAAEKEKEIMAI